MIIEHEKRFYAWLMNFRGYDTAFGDVASAVSIDKFVKKLPNERRIWLDHIDPVGDSKISGILNELFDKFESGESHPAPLKQKRHSNSDDEWTISSPTIPNYHFTTERSICRVFTRSADVVADYEYRIREWNAFRNHSCVAVHGAVYGYAVEKLGSYFRREFGYDFLPYTWRGHLDSAWFPDKHGKVAAYLFLSDTYSTKTRAIGACGFFLPKGQSRWQMNFAYLHPLARRRGHLSGAWKLFQFIHGDFWTEYPISNAMKSFLQKRGEMDKHANQYSTKEPTA